MINTGANPFHVQLADEERIVCERLQQTNIESYQITTIINKLRLSALSLATAYSPPNTDMDTIYKRAALFMKDATRNWKWRNAKDFYEWILLFDMEKKDGAVAAISSQWAQKIFQVTQLRPISHPNVQR